MILGWLFKHGMVDICPTSSSTLSGLSSAYRDLSIEHVDHCSWKELATDNNGHKDPGTDTVDITLHMEINVPLLARAPLFCDL